MHIIHVGTHEEKKFLPASQRGAQIYRRHLPDPRFCALFQHLFLRYGNLKTLNLPPNLVHSAE